ncbi:methyl-accepting chemotaxis protein [Desulforamulus aeronauticus]|uniref:Methyl-accepting chemotaxis protein n=1 Tax=Desulforamulus aeronauticus DSM 10349 TaxID=1121421 RepID=A0A1M6TN11_9FIRM|nr:methyl-accepting chemotaxis protein [Desulforamulus aeronauticus]SHK58310.1 methyl-accepting chemotaxis protein [Desulforamulus aeronauticus DSM 10349]
MKKIGTKIWLGFVSVLLLMTVMVGITYYQLGQIKSEMNTLAEQRIPVTIASQRLALNHMKQAASLRGYLASGDAKFQNDYHEAKEKTDEQLAILEKTIETEEHRERLKQVKQVMGEFDPMPPVMFKLYQEEGQKASVNYLINIAAPVHAKSLTEINKFTEMQEESIHEDTLHVAAIEKKIEKQLLLLLGVAILLGAVIAYFIAKPIEKALSNVTQASAEYANGDFRKEITASSADEIGQMAAALNKMRENFVGVILKLKDSSEQLNDAALGLAAQTQQTSAGATQTAGNVTEIAATVEEVAGNAQEVAGLSEKTAREAELGYQGSEQVTRQMAVIASSSDEAASVIEALSQTLQQVNQIVELITNIADQTNLLALNAAIEAARAGEQGKGFAVVAEEVRKLAEKSAVAAKDISQMIGRVQVESKRAVEAMSNGNEQVKEGLLVVGEVGQKFHVIIESIEKLAQQIRSVAVASDQISEGIQNVASTTEEQSASIEEVTASTEHLTKMASDLNEMVHRFKV